MDPHEGDRSAVEAIRPELTGDQIILAAQNTKNLGNIGLLVVAAVLNLTTVFLNLAAVLHGPVWAAPALSTVLIGLATVACSSVITSRGIGAFFNRLLVQDRRLSLYMRRADDFELENTADPEFVRTFADRPGDLAELYRRTPGDLLAAHVEEKLTVNTLMELRARGLTNGQLLARWALYVAVVGVLIGIWAVGG